ncbi:cation:proton antiporter [Pontibacter silvestris]|uniref:Cation:proton antiporter n=1 Tax=Pontibacter silvestris TaxID=2305183 RepID=A0ABW4WVW8_9BACT|nr:sodium:proton antiporter [Pontibacter silvestris]MCC9136982.1 sodium:proton antiporter [Pontibacter silvestris]
MKDFILALACTSFLVLVMGFIYKKIKRSFLSEPIIALAMGIVLGPAVLNLLDMHKWGPFEKILDAACQLTISMALMATAFRIPKSYAEKHWRLQSILLFFGMLGMCALSTLLMRLVFGFDWLICLLIGAVITPTDPVVSSTVVSGETARQLIPDRVRHAISFESAANDGMAFPLVLLPLLLLQKPEGAWQEWLLKPVLWETGGGILFGVLIGYTAGKLLVKARNINWMTKSVLLSFSLSLGFTVLGLLEIIKSNGILGVFAAGFAANLVLDKDEDLEQEEIQESLERIFTIPIFVLFGLVLPWSDWWALGWNAVIIVVAVLLFRRLPVIFALGPFLKKLPKKADLVMVGWFGPIGVAAIYYMALTLSKTGMHEVWVVGSLIVFGSTIVHGLTGYPFAKLYSRWESNDKSKEETK